MECLRLGRHSVSELKGSLLSDWSKHILSSLIPPKLRIDYYLEHLLHGVLPEKVCAGIISLASAKEVLED